MSICAKQPPGTHNCNGCPCGKEVRDEAKAARENAGVRPNDNGGSGR